MTKGSPNHQYVVLFADNGEYAGPFKSLEEARVWLQQGVEVFGDNPEVDIIPLTIPDWHPVV